MIVPIIINDPIKCSTIIERKREEDGWYFSNILMV
jgi:hypothetical protein